MLKTTLLVLALAAGSAQQQNTAPQRSGADSSRDNSTQVMVPVSKPSPLVDERIADYTRLLALFTGGLFLVTGILALYTYRLWGATRTLVEDSRKNAQRQLRAYVFADKWSTVGPLPAYPEVAVYRLLFKNSGQTPAHQVRITYEGAVVTISPPGDFPAIPQSLPEETVLSMAPGGKSFSTFNHTGLLPGFAASIVAGTDEFYLYGRISYVDAFEVKHNTYFRFKRRAGHHDLIATQEGNYSD